MVGLLAMAIGASLPVGLVRGAAGRPEVWRPAVLSAIAFAVVDVWYTARGCIRPMYLADGVIELFFVLVVILAGHRVREE